MGTGQDHFALDWIKSELFETLNDARQALEAYVESDRDETRMRACLTGLHQVHGTLVMLELDGVTLLADHLELLAQGMLDGKVAAAAEPAASQTLMQGILELPGRIEEIQQGDADSPQSVLKLVNEVRAFLGKPPMGGDVARIPAASSEASLSRFSQIDGVDKVRKIRAAYQQVLLSILKGEELAGSLGMLEKVAQGLERVCQGAPQVAVWQAFAEFIKSLSGVRGPLPGDAVKLLRRVDSEIRFLAQEGVAALQKPLATELVLQLVEAARSRGRASERLTELESALKQTEASGGLVISGRQALASAAGALREELALVKDRLDLSVRSEQGSPDDLISLVAPLKQIGSTLSLLGFESSKSIILDQIDVLNRVTEGHALDQPTLLAVAGALVQVDENLASFTHGGKGEAERITDDAQRTVAAEGRQGLDAVKQSIVDYVSSGWDARHLEHTESQLASICGALDMIPLPRASRLLHSCSSYISSKMTGQQPPGWEALDHLADAISGVDYYLERLTENNSVGADDILELVERSLETLGIDTDAVVPKVLTTTTPPAAELETSPAEEPAEETSAEAEVAGVGGETTINETELPTGEAPEPKLEMDDDPGFDLDNVFLEPAESSVAAGADTDIPVDEAAEESRFELEVELETESDNEAVNELAADLAEETAQEPEETSAEWEFAAGEAEATVEFAAESDEAITVEKDVVASTLSSPTNPSLVDTFETDAEIVEIFVEEVDEVLETIAECLPQWREQLDHEEALAEVRRAFHTLKGSGRIVGANVIGELAWSVENMLNRIIDGTVVPTPAFITVVEDARALVPSLRDAFEMQRPVQMESLSLIMERADVLASGGSLEDTSETTPAVAVEESDSQEVFLAEAQIHMGVLNASIQGAGVMLDENCMRALHTLAGSAGMAGIEVVASLARPVYELAQALRPDQDLVVEGDQAAFLSQSFAAFNSILDDLAHGREADDYAQLIADADHLLLVAAADPEVEARSEARDRLLGLEGLSVLMDASEFLQNWHAGALDLENSDRMNAALQEVSQVARETDRDAIADLADALAGVHKALADDVLSDDARIVLDQGHDRLLELFDAVAADQDLVPADDVIADLIGLPLEVTAEEDLDEPIEVELEALAAQDARDIFADVKAPPVEKLEEERSASADVKPAEISADAETRQRSSAPAFSDSDSAFTFPDSSEDDEDAALDEEISLDDLADDYLKSFKDEAAQRQSSPPPDRAPADEEVAPPRASAPRQHEPATPKSTQPLDPAIAALLPDDLDEEIVEVFFEEADEILEALDENVHQWAREPGNRLFLEHMLRGLHTLKGGARLAGLMKLGDATHDLESTLIEFQAGSAEVSNEFFSDLAGQFDELSSLLAVIKAAMAGEAVTWPVSEAADSVEAVEQDAAAVPVQPVDVTEETAASLEAADIEIGDTVVPAVTRKSAPEAARPAPADKAESREKADQRSSQEMVRVGSGLLENLVNLAGESSIVRARIEQGMSDFTSALDEMETTIERVREQLRRLEIETETQILFRSDRPEGPSYDDFDPLEMDRYSQLQQLSRGLSESASDMLDLKDTLLFKARESETLLLQQARINTELQEGLMRTRMVPFSRLLPRLRRIVRQVAGELGKEVEFHAFNAEGELDRNLLERMVPPLEHMLRNAVDHGIESRELRKNYGKPPTGRIDLRLSREGGDVVIEISDDGSGIDVESVRAKAVERGLMASGASLRDDEICQFVLAPGFTTAKSITQISGRGVGMDVVHSEVKQLGGSIQIASRQGKGTRFIVRVPFTVSVNRALMVSVGEDFYAIPLNTIEGIVLLSPDELERLYAPEGNTFEYAGIPYRVRYLGHYLGREFRASALQNSVPVVLVRSGDHAVAVHVDGVQGSREIVVKSLGPQFAGVGGISGATILGDGSVVVILDLLALIRAQASGSQAGSRRPLSAGNRTRCVMVVDDSVTVRKVTSRLLERQGMDVLVAKDGIEAISLLQERRPDVMLLDIEMPRMDGFEVARQVRHDDRLADLPIIMISSRTGEKHQEHAAQLGVNSFLGKPFQENELLATIDRLVN